MISPHTPERLVDQVKRRAAIIPRTHIHIQTHIDIHIITHTYTYTYKHI